MSALIVSRHTGIVEWLARRGITGEVIDHVRDPQQVAGRVVYGILPLHLAALTERLCTVDMPGLPPEQRGQDLSPEEMDRYGARLTCYRVTIADGNAPRI